MKRSWLSLGFIAIIIVVVTIGIYHESNVILKHSLRRFQAALPPGAELSYRKANPNFLIRGATLHDVTFRYRNTLFHAHSVRMGHPQILSNGKVRFSSLFIKEPSYSTTQLQVSMESLVFRHLLVPKDNAPLTDEDITTASMHSLAGLTSFALKDLSPIRFEWGRIRGLHLNLLPTAPAYTDLLQEGIGLHTLDANIITLEGYGLGGRVAISIQHFATALNIVPEQIIPSSLFPLSTAFFPQLRDGSPSQNGKTNLLYHLTVESLEAREGTTRLLQHPFRTDTATARQFWKRPLDVLWQNPGTLTLDQLSLIRDGNPPQSALRLDHLVTTRREEDSGLHTEAMLQGFHLHPATGRIPYTIHGTDSTLRLSGRGIRDYGAWHNTVTGRLNLPPIGEITFNNHTAFPSELTALLSEQVVLSNTTITVHGDNFVGLMLALFPQTSPQNAQTRRNAVVGALNALSGERPLLTPLSDYIANPQNRTLHVTFGHFSLDTLKKIPFSGSGTALFDALHITAMSAQ